MSETSTGDDTVEPPPEGRAPFSGMTLDPVPFGSPPPEPVVIEGEPPWELREEVPFDDE
ncbi:MAG: hypothetical protein V4479_00255 [Actinomycetota bacterium]